MLNTLATYSRDVCAIERRSLARDWRAAIDLQRFCGGPRLAEPALAACVSSGR
jgi:hypothetical protein